jgi:hypothetical protein
LVTLTRSGSPTTHRRSRVARCLAIVLLAASCGRPQTPALRMTQPDGRAAFVEVVGLPSSTLDALQSRQRTADEWAAILRVAVTADGPPVLGEYAVVDDALRFTPAFPFDPGRPYAVRFNGAAAGDTSGPLFGTLALPGAAATSSTTVTAVYPSGEVVPENLLRLYIHFSAPMGQGGIDHVELLDASGTLVEGAFLPLDYEFFDTDRTRFTAFLDPGRVKRGILPNRQRGRALKSGQRYTLVVKAAWRDGNGHPLKEEFRRTFTAGPAEMQPLDTATWKLAAPDGAGTSGPGPAELTVTFPKPLDRGLLLRALGIRRDGQQVDGQARVEAGETKWVFTPAAPWTAGRYELVALSILEDPAGNQIGKAFEIDNFETVDKSPDPKTVAIPFSVGGSGWSLVRRDPFPAPVPVTSAPPGN